MLVRHYLPGNSLVLTAHLDHDNDDIVINVAGCLTVGEYGWAEAAEDAVFLRLRQGGELVEPAVAAGFVRRRLLGVQSRRRSWVEGSVVDCDETIRVRVREFRFPRPGRVNTIIRFTE